MNPQEVMRILDSIARDRNIDRSLLIHDLEQAMLSAVRKYFGTIDTDEFTCEFDQLTGQFNLFRMGEPLEIPPGELGRISAQTFSSVPLSFGYCSDNFLMKSWWTSWYISSNRCQSSPERRSSST